MDDHNQLSPKIIEWLKKKIGGAFEIQQISALKGSTSSHLSEITAKRGEQLRHFVLRLFTWEEWLAMEPDLAKHEAASLLEAGRTGLKVPEMIAFDETGEQCGLPAVLMTKIEGAVVLQPADENAWFTGMAQTLARIHEHGAEDFQWEYFSYNDALKMEKPVWSNHADDWMRAFYIAAGVRPPTEFCFIHRDFHPANVLWEDGRISGVVDWVNACRGPAGVDLGHCRVNLAMLYGVSAADRFLEAYQKAAAGKFIYHPHWDLLSLVDVVEGPPAVYPGWAVFGMTGLTDELMRHRLDEYLLSLLNRFDE